MTRILLATMIIAATIGADRAAAQKQEPRRDSRALHVYLHFGIGPGVVLGLTMGEAEPPPASKIAIVNVGTVFVNYEKAKEFKVRLQEQVDPYKAKMDKWQKEMTEYQNLLQKHDPRYNEDALKKKITERKRALEDANAEVRKLVGKQSEQQLVQLWNEINDAAKKHAVAHGFAMVLGYGDPHDAKELFTFANINRKMQGMDQGGVTPLYAHPNCDITDALVLRLNHAYREQLRKMADGRK